MSAKELSPYLFERVINQRIINHVFLIKFNNNIGTCFEIEVDGKEYMVTAKHVIKGINDADNIELFKENGWIKVPIRLVGNHKFADVSVFSLNFHPECIQNAINCGTSVYYSQGVYFLGFPYGMHQDEVARLVNGMYPMAFVKKAILSAIVKEKEYTIFILDGNNNPGFSGGPVIYYDMEKKENCVLGIISSYRIDPQEIIDKNGNIVKDVVSKGNSGIINVYSIECALKLISQNPIGYINK